MGVVPTGKTRVYIAGAPGGGSIAPPAHDFIAQCLGRHWKMSFLEASTLQEVVDAFRTPDFAGGIVTMPWKKSIIPHLDEVDDMVFKLGACNHVSVTEDGALHGTNTDWIGIMNALLQGLALTPNVAGRRGLVIGAGGASRAAVYALTKIGCKDIYIVNRDAEEVHDLVRDVQNYEALSRPNITHVQTVRQAQNHPTPDYIVSTVPDFEPTTASEIEARGIFTEFLSKKDRSAESIVLDMCYHPMFTRNLLLAKKHGWRVVDGIQVVGYQLKVQWKPWTGQEIDKHQEEVAWEILRKSALSDPTVTAKKGKF